MPPGWQRRWRRLCPRDAAVRWRREDPWHASCRSRLVDLLLAPPRQRLCKLCLKSSHFGFRSALPLHQSSSLLERERRERRRRCSARRRRAWWLGLANHRGGRRASWRGRRLRPPSLWRGHGWQGLRRRLPRGRYRLGGQGLRLRLRLQDRAQPTPPPWWRCHRRRRCREVRRHVARLSRAPSRIHARDACGDVRGRRRANHRRSSVPRPRVMVRRLPRLRGGLCGGLPG